MRKPMISKPSIWLLALVVSEATWVGLGLSRYPESSFATFVVLFFANFGIYALLFLGARKRVVPWPSPLILWSGAILFRLTMLLFEPTLSDDIYRYLWEGRIQAEGFNPFLLEPEAAELEHLRDEVYHRVNHPRIPTIYPPLMQFLFVGVTSINYATWTMKAALVAFDLGTLWLLCLILAGRGKPTGEAFVYGWSPLLVMEVAWNGHNDSAFIFFLVLALWAASRGRRFLSVLALASSILSKLAGALYLPLLLIRIGWRWIILIPPLVALCYLPYKEAGWGVFTGLFAYGKEWQFNGSIFSILDWALGGGWPPRMAAAALLLLATGRSSRGHGNSAARMLWLTGALLLLSPTVHPWYVAWLVPFLVLAPRWPWLLWTGSVALSYHVLGGFLASGEWREAAWIRVVEYLPLYTGLLLGAWFQWRGWSRSDPESDAVA